MYIYIFISIGSIRKILCHLREGLLVVGSSRGVENGGLLFVIFLYQSYKFLYKEHMWLSLKGCFIFLRTYRGLWWWAFHGVLATNVCHDQSQIRLTSLNTVSSSTLLWVWLSINLSGRTSCSSAARWERVFTALSACWGQKGLCNLCSAFTTLSHNCLKDRQDTFLFHFDRGGSERQLNQPRSCDWKVSEPQLNLVKN